MSEKFFKLWILSRHLLQSLHRNFIALPALASYSKLQPNSFSHFHFLTVFAPASFGMFSLIHKDISLVKSSQMTIVLANSEFDYFAFCQKCQSD